MKTVTETPARKLIPQIIQSPIRALTIARVLWILLAAALLAMIGFSIAGNPAWISPSLPMPELATLQRAGLRASDYAALRAALELIVVFSFTAAAFVIYWSKRDDGMALLVSAALLTFGATVFPVIAIPSLNSLVRWIQILGIALAGLTIFLFPNGRFFPAWTRPLALGLGIWLAALLVFPEVTASVSSLAWLNPIQTAVRLVAWLFGTDVSAGAFDQAVQSVRTIGLVSMMIGGFGAGAAAQIFRYLHTSDPAERQQTKLVVFGLAVAVSVSLLYYLLPVFAASLSRPGPARLIFQAAGQFIFSVALVLVPLFLMIAVLRYRLWEVDLLINRTMVYLLLTGVLAAVYFVSIYLLQAVVQAVTGQESDWVLVGSTLVIAALFRPVRDRVQIFIDRRFYREKVDFRRVFTEFGSGIRTVIELPELQQTLVNRVSDLLHIQYAALYLRRAENTYPSAYALRFAADAGLETVIAPEDLHRLESGGIVSHPARLPFPILVPLIAPQSGGGMPVGILALGPRLSGEGYSREDQSLLLGLAEQAGTSIRVTQLIDEKQNETRRRLDAEKQLADRRNSPAGRAETAAEQILSGPQSALREFHRRVQESEHDQDAAELVANLPGALKNSGAETLSRLAEGFSYLLEGRVSAGMLPGALRIILAALDAQMPSDTTLSGGTAAHGFYSACLRALGAGSVSEIAGWKKAPETLEKTGGRVADDDAEFLSVPDRMLADLGGISEYLQAIERVDAAQDKLAYLTEAIERLERLNRTARNELGPADRPILAAIAAHWIDLTAAAKNELQSRAQIACELLTRHLWRADEITLVLAVRNSGRGIARQLTAQLMPAPEYRALGEARVLPALGPGEEAQVEISLRPALAPDRDLFRVLLEIRYSDPRAEDQSESFADSIQLLEPSRAFTVVPNPYVVGIPLKAGSPMFFGREDVLDFLLEQLTAAHRNNLVLIGPRRTGKSSLLKQLPSRLGDDFLPVYLDGQALALDPGLPAFLHAVATEISLSAGERGRPIAVPDLAAFAPNPAAFFEKSFLADARRALGERHLLLLLDEFEELESAARRGTLDASIFPFLRHLIQHAGNLSVIFCGTHQLEELASDYWSVLFNISLYRHIGFLSKPEAVRLIQEPVAEYGMQCDDLALEKIWRVTAGHPYFLQLICHSLVNRHNRQRRSTVTVADVNAAVEEILTTGEAHFVYLWMESTPVQKLALYAMSRLGGAGSLAPGQAAEELARQGITVDADALGGAFRNLAARDIFAVFHQPNPPFAEIYAWKLGLLGSWVEKSRSLDRILAEEKARG